MSYNGNCNNPWHKADLNQRLTELHALTGKEALSMRQITARLNAEFKTEFTRNAIIGRSRRLGLPARPQPIPTRSYPTKQIVLVGHSSYPPIVPIEARRPTRRDSLNILQLRDGDCHWPLGEMDDRPPFQYCGKPALFGFPYCLEHHRIAHHGVRP
jgi:GcrA cell cycle regulator